MNAADPAFVARPTGWTADHELRWRLLYGRLLKTEGPFVNDPKDPGGATKYGVSLRFLVINGLIDADRDGFADFDLDRDGDIDALDVKLLTPANAEALYLPKFFIETKFWRLPAPIDAAIFDLGVNVGTRTAVRLLQRAVNRFGPPPLATDGVLGEKTFGGVAEAQRTGPLLTEIRNEAAAHYRWLVSRNGELERFLGGWLNRAKELGRVA
ncbi:glycoside hydrolase family 108 protein [Caulobacter sp. BP25]|uniref:glycoside hydrolase family 108 protein n=1 Tax=Caulobacter sp. BP25 TaxID=2048900 RepID=UPI000C129E59|nr:glycosyl hydrolase 108 family protein [Caulobacter sp. BP25]PHY20797.1 hypothetical protein CSW59_06120 [Caulobacter sp. BP25]